MLSSDMDLGREGWRKLGVVGSMCGLVRIEGQIADLATQPAGVKVIDGSG